MNRLDKVVVFHPLRREQLEEVLEIEWGMQQRVLRPPRDNFYSVSRRGEFLLQEGTDQYGARHKEGDRRHVVNPLANHSTEQVHLGDLVHRLNKEVRLSYSRRRKSGDASTPARNRSGAHCASAERKERRSTFDRHRS